MNGINMRKYDIFTPKSINSPTPVFTFCPAPEGWARHRDYIVWLYVVWMDGVRSLGWSFRFKLFLLSCMNIVSKTDWMERVGDENWCSIIFILFFYFLSILIIAIFTCISMGFNGVEYLGYSFWMEFFVACSTRYEYGNWLDG